jgi:hypothetical protein
MRLAGSVCSELVPALSWCLLLPCQILRLRDLMRRGIAVHHAGLLPIMKETVEMLFCQGYIKVGGGIRAAPGVALQTEME